MPFELRSPIPRAPDGAPPSPLEGERRRGRGGGFACVLALASALLVQPSPAAEAPPPPMAERKPVTTEHHGIAITDDYAWLRTSKLEAVLARPEALEAPIRRHLDAEARYARAVLVGNRNLERQLLAEMKARVSPRDATVPQAWGPWEYYLRYAEGSQRRLHCRRPRGGGPEQIMLDENVLAKGRRGFSVSDAAVSFDHKLLAYAVDGDGSERNTLKVRDLATGRDLADTIPEVRGGAVWSADSQWLFYVGRDPAKWGQKVFRHRLGTPVAEDELVYEESEEGFAVSLRPSLSDRFLVMEFGRLLDHRYQAGRAFGPDRAAAVGRAAQGWHQVHGLRPRRPARLHDQRRRSHRLEDRGQAAVGRPRRTLRGDRAARAGSAHRGLRGAERPPRLARARPRQGPPANPHPALVGRDRARHHLRRGAGQGGACRRARAEDAHAALHLPVHGAAAAGHRLRSRHARAQRCARCRRSRAGTIPHATSRGVSRRRQPTARASPPPCSTARTRRSTARRRSGSTPTAPTATRSTPTSAPSGCRSSTAASSTSSPMCAAAARRASPGTRPAASPTRPPRSRISSPSPITSSGST